jgi:O-antigen ligase
LTFSLTGYLFLIPILALALYDRWRAGRLELRRRGLVVVAGLVLVLLPLAPTVYRTVVVRAMRSVSGAGDTSSFLRLQGNWKMTYYLLETSPVLGVGLGNFDVVAWDLRAFIFQGYLIEKHTQGWNVFAYVLATLGLPGLLLLLAMLASAFRGRARLAIAFVLGMFADGTFLGAAFWFFLALYISDGEDEASGGTPGAASRRPGTP